MIQVCSQTVNTCCVGVSQKQVPRKKNKDNWNLNDKIKSGHVAGNVVTATLSTCSEGLTWIRSITVPLQDKLKQWPHAAPLQLGLAWTISSLCRSILHFSWACLRSLTTVWVTSFPALLLVYGVLAQSCLWYHGGRGIKRRTVWKDLQDQGGKNHPELATTTGLIQETPSPKFSLNSAILTTLHDRCLHVTLRQLAVMIYTKWRKHTMEHFSLNRHLMV